MIGLSQPDGDEVFDLLVHAYDAVDPDQCQDFLARLCVLFAQRVGDVAAVREIIHQARQAAPTPSQKG
jgi:hypothetical protein